MEIHTIKLKIDTDLDEFLHKIEIQWRKNLRQVYPLYWKIPLEWKLEKSIASLWAIDTKSNKLTFHLQMNKGKIQKELRKSFKFISQQKISLFEELFQYLLFHYFFHIIEAPFSDTGEFNDNKLIHKAIWDGIVTAEPDLTKYEILEKVFLCHSIVKDFIIDNRLYLENFEFGWFTKEVLLVPYYNYLLQYKLPEINFFLIISYINTALYGSEAMIRFLEKKFLSDVAENADEVLAKLFSSNKSILISSKKKKDGGLVPQLITTNRLQFIKELRRVFQGDSRYDSIKTLVTILSPSINKSLETISTHSSVSFTEVITDIFDQFSPGEQSSLVHEILDSKQTIVNNETEINSVSLELRILHEFYLRNNPIIEIKGELGINKAIYHSENHFIKLKKTDIINISSAKHIDLGKINSFQKSYGIPMLIPLEDETFLLNEYELKYKKSRNIRYKIRSGEKFDAPDVLELYLDKTGSMFFEEDVDYRGWNDGSRYDNSISVLYGFITALFEEAKKQNKTCYVRFHSFSEIQINSPLRTLQEFLEGDPSILKILFNPGNGYDYENLNLEIYNDGLKRVYVLITDGDLVIEGRTEREAKKLKLIARNPLNKVILFEMERQFSLGLAVQHEPQIISHCVKNKELMFQQGIAVILPS
ncbi:MAG: hypothetical protein HeimC3_36380 [Candidatus Heimdallarchaeota archaeon LC_3]|nr:MAG: hypothetical protein HeimC3_36380 [Candidatus Heimdallarchaeota archaeon LC_3]